MDLHALTDRIEISELLARYARAVDSKDWDLYRSVFTEDAHIDYSSAGAAVGDLTTVTEFLATALGPFPMTMHYITNVECEIDGDEARVRAMFYNPMQFPGAAPGDLSSCGGYYHHRLVRTAEGWRSRELIEENCWFVNPPTD